MAVPGPPPEVPMNELVAVGVLTGLLAGLARFTVVVALRPVRVWVWVGRLLSVATMLSVPENSPMTRGVRPWPLPWPTGNRPCRFGNWKLVVPLPP
ncbi:hypothetical protein D3C75_1093890 [compost metagenome]